MEILAMLLIVVFLTLESVCAKEYDKKTNEGALLFSAITVFFAAVVFVISFFVSGNNGFAFSWETLGYAVLFAFTYGSATVGTIYAIKYGPLSLTTLFISFSLLIPTLYGVVVLGETADTMLFVGLALLAVSLVLVNIEDKSSKSNVKITFKWVLFVIMGFVGNGICTITQKMQQVNQQGQYKNEFMIVALFMVFASLVILSFVLEKNQAKCLKIGITSGGIRGLANGVVNLLVISLALTVDASVLFPVISGGGIALTTLVAMTLYREKLSTKQLLGMIFGIASVIVLNI